MATKRKYQLVTSHAGPGGFTPERTRQLISVADSTFVSIVFIKKDGYEINGKSIIGVMTLAAEQGSTVLLIFDGPDEAEASDAVIELFESGFGEVQ